MIPVAAIESNKFKSVKPLISEDETFTDILECLLANGNTDELGEFVVFEDEKVTIKFKDDVWPFIDSDLDFDGGSVNLKFIFDHEISSFSNVLSINNSVSEIKYQLKVLAVVCIYLSSNKIQLKTLKNKLNSLKRIIPILLKHGVKDFSMLTDEKLALIKDNDPIAFSTRTNLEGLNSLYDVIPWLPFELNYTRLKYKCYADAWRAPEQFAVIPPRIYFDLMNWGKAMVKYYKTISWEVETAVEKLLEFEEQELELAIKSIRNGERSVQLGEPTKGSIKFEKELEANGVDLVDYGANPLWVDVFKKCDFKIALGSNRAALFNVKVAGKSYGRVEIKDLLREIAGTCGFVCIQLSGMRVDELYGAYIDFGAQKLDLSDSKRKSKKETIYLLTTRQSKIKKGTQTKKDTFVTTEDGYDAFNILTALFRGFNKRFASKDKRRMWAGFRSCQSVTPCEPTCIANYIVSAVKDLSNVSLKLTSDDVVYLNTSDPAKDLKRDEDFPITSHTLRRSLAYYLIGYELCSFPALKQQLSHLSIAMTRWYARNSSYFTEVYKQVNKERVEQLADIYVRIYSKLANGERVAGGKGKQAARDISRQGKSYFKDGANKNLLSRAYWVDQLKSNVKHLHVIAPSMVCTNKLCSMRINIDLTECVDCEFDFIEDVAFAETSRIDAMRNLHLLYEQDDLNHSSLSKLVMTIKAAERIMNDLNFDYEPYTLSDELSEMFIHTASKAEAL